MPDRSLRLRALPRPESVRDLKIGAQMFVAELTPKGGVNRRGGIHENPLCARLILTAVLLTTGASAAPVPANSVVNAPNWSAGSKWHYSDGYAVKVTSVSPKHAVSSAWMRRANGSSREGFMRTDCTRAPRRATPSIAPFPTMRARAVRRQAADLPARISVNNGKLMVHARSWSVEGRETITVPAGTFDCWIIVWRSRSLKSDWTGFERWWYSPMARIMCAWNINMAPMPKARGC